jgi:hypothetical protein
MTKINNATANEAENGPINDLRIEACSFFNLCIVNDAKLMKMAVAIPYL